MERELERRFNALALLVVFVFTVLFGRLGYLQIIRREEYQRLADGNRIRLIPIPASRGVIYDRNGVPIVNSRPAYTVSLIPLGQGIDPQVLDRLANILGMSRADLDQLIKERQGRPFEPIRIASDITPEVYTKIEEDRYELPGVVVDVQPVRNYVYGDFASQVLGYVREISAEQLKALEAKGITDYKMGDLYGQMGIENKLDQYLRGQAGGRQVEVDSLGRPIRIVGEQKPVPGDDVTLTLDAQLQLVAEQALADSFKKLQAQGNDVHAGAVVVEDVRNGQILAIASKPSFDPNIFNGIITTALYKQLFNNPLNPFNNRVLTGTFAPGSTFKMVVAAAALQEGVVTPNEIITCTGQYWTIAPKKCWVPTGHGPENIVQALQNSCNVFFYEMGRRLGPDRIASYARQFGFGEPTGIDLPGERAGTLPSTTWKEQAAKAGIVSDGRWWPAETLDMAIGQGFDAFTPLQLVNYVATLANGGTRYQPYLIQQIRDPSGKIVMQNQPKVLNTVSVSPQTLDVVRQGMLAVAEQGTAAWIFKNYPIQVAGKTGTAETGRGDKNNGWFVAYAPFDKPEIAVAVLVEGGGHGSTSGAPVAKAIFDQYFHLAPAPAASTAGAGAAGTAPAASGGTALQAPTAGTPARPAQAEQPTQPAQPAQPAQTPTGGSEPASSPAAPAGGTGAPPAGARPAGAGASRTPAAPLLLRAAACRRPAPDSRLKPWEVRSGRLHPDTRKTEIAAAICRNKGKKRGRKLAPFAIQWQDCPPRRVNLHLRPPQTAGLRGLRRSALNAPCRRSHGDTPSRAGGRHTMAERETALLVRRTLRAGQQVRYSGTVVVLGDVNPGATVIAGADIVVVGQLRGFAYAGAGGDERATIVAFRLRPSQIRIAHHIARSPEAPQAEPDQPEMASVVDGALVIRPYRPLLYGRELRGGSAEWGRSSS